MDSAQGMIWHLILEIVWAKVKKNEIKPPLVEHLAMSFENQPDAVALLANFMIRERNTKIQICV